MRYTHAALYAVLHAQPSRVVLKRARPNTQPPGNDALAVHSPLHAAYLTYETHAARQTEPKKRGIS